MSPIYLCKDEADSALDTVDPARHAFAEEGAMWLNPPSASCLSPSPTKSLNCAILVVEMLDLGEIIETTTRSHPFGRPLLAGRSSRQFAMWLGAG